jgi:hypothetical protein
MPQRYARADERNRSLILGEGWGVEVALVNVRADGTTWLATVNRHRTSHVGVRTGHGIHQSRDAAMRMLTRWAWAHADRLRREVAALSSR